MTPGATDASLSISFPNVHQAIKTVNCGHPADKSYGKLASDKKTRHDFKFKLTESRHKTDFNRSPLIERGDNIVNSLPRRPPISWEWSSSEWIWQTFRIIRPTWTFSGFEVKDNATKGHFFIIVKFILFSSFYVIWPNDCLKCHKNLQSNESMKSIC